MCSACSSPLHVNDTLVERRTTKNAPETILWRYKTDGFQGLENPPWYNTLNLDLYEVIMINKFARPGTPSSCGRTRSFHLRYAVIWCRSLSGYQQESKARSLLILGCLLATSPPSDLQRLYEQMGDDIGYRSKIVCNWEKMAWEELSYQHGTLGVQPGIM